MIGPAKAQGRTALRGYPHLLHRGEDEATAAPCAMAARARARLAAPACWQHEQLGLAASRAQGRALICGCVRLARLLPTAALSRVPTAAHGDGCRACSRAIPATATLGRLTSMPVLLAWQLAFPTVVLKIIDYKNKYP